MKIETPQILWNAAEEDGGSGSGGKALAAPLMSIAVVASGVSLTAQAANACTHVLATAGNTSTINLFKLGLNYSHDHDADDNDNDDENAVKKKSMLVSSSRHNNNTSSAVTKTDFLCSLTRHEGGVNCVRFSPDGLHLATVGDTGAIIVWSVPVSKRGNNNGQHYWSTVTREQDLMVRILHGGTTDGVNDLSWSADSKRFMVGTIDHAVLVFEDQSFDANHHASPAAQAPKDSVWKVVHRNAMDHKCFVQGVAYDPLGVYLTSMSSDRSVRIFPRKTPPKSKKKVLRPANTTMGDSVPPVEHQHMVSTLLTDAKLELQKSKQLKYRRNTSVMDDATAASGGDVGNKATTISKKSHLFCDEATAQSFVRRLSWTSDGAYLITPMALSAPYLATEGVTTAHSNAPSFATYMYARHKFDEPCKILGGLDKPSVAVAPNPVLFHVACAPTDVKENCSPTSEPGGGGHSSSKRRLPYRSVFAVLTHDTVLVYDTRASAPLALAQNLHCTNLVDATWTPDGRHLLVCSTDGYISIMSFGAGELGQVYTPPSWTSPLSHHSPVAAQSPSPPLMRRPTISVAAAAAAASSPVLLLPPTEPGTSVVHAPPAKKTRITPTLVHSVSHNKRPADGEAAKQDVTQLQALSLQDTEQHDMVMTANNTTEEQEQEQPKKKKRVQPILLSSL